MAAERTSGLVLGGVALVTGIAAVALDAGALGVVAGVAGLGAGAVAARAVARADEAEHEATTAEARVSEAQAALAAASSRTAELEAVLASLPPEPEPNPENILTDAETGLPGEAFFAISLTSRVAAARRHLRPVAVVLIEVTDADGRAADVAAIAEDLRSTLRSADTACRLDGPTRFGLVLEDTPENGAVWSVERFRRALAGNGPTHILRAGIACYPAHAFDAGELRQRATDALLAARQWRQDRIEVATSSEV